jgi:hypothetical protein
VRSPKPRHPASITQAFPTHIASSLGRHGLAHRASSLRMLPLVHVVRARPARRKLGLRGIIHCELAPKGVARPRRYRLARKATRGSWGHPPRACPPASSSASSPVACALLRSRAHPQVTTSSRGSPPPLASLARGSLSPSYVLC